MRVCKGNRRPQTSQSLRAMLLEPCYTNPTDREEVGFGNTLLAKLLSIYREKKVLGKGHLNWIFPSLFFPIDFQ